MCSRACSWRGTPPGALAWVGVTTGVGVAAAAGAGVAHPPPGAGNVIYLGVRLSPQELASREAQSALLGLRSSAVVDASSAEADRRAVRRLAAKGLDVESGGLGGAVGGRGEPDALWALALSATRSAQQLSAICGRTVGVLVPDRRVSIFDLVDTSSAHLMMVVPNATLPVAPGGRPPPGTSRPAATSRADLRRRGPECDARTPARPAFQR